MSEATDGHLDKQDPLSRYFGLTRLDFKPTNAGLGLAVTSLCGKKV